MKKLTRNDPETRSPDLVAENLAALKALFPELITEGPDGAAVNVDVLKALVGDKTVTDAEEKYGLNWHGKRRARQLALTPSTGTLRPCPEESVDWDTTQNLMIEGDNLEVLKLLQKSYAGKVKLIYIDPPYNTGKDFVYPDNFQDNIKNYLELTGQVEGGQKITSINGQHMIKKATEVFGPVGIGWGWTVVEERFDKGGEIRKDTGEVIGNEVGHTQRLRPHRGTAMRGAHIGGHAEQGNGELGMRHVGSSGWCRLSDSNGRPTAYKAVALPAELKRRACAAF